MTATTPTTLSQSAPAAWFVSVNPVLAAGEFGHESDTRRFKVGNGTAKWSALPYGAGNAPAVTGSRASGAALTSLLAVLAAAGIITDSTTA